MDAIPCDFVERVFAQLEVDEIRFTKFQSPLWIHADRTYKEKLQCLTIFIYITKAETSFQFNVYKSENHTIPDFTVEEFLGMDARFTRIKTVLITDSPPNNGDRTEYPVERVPAIIRRLSRFYLNCLNMTFYVPINSFCFECLKPKRLETTYTPQTDDFFKNVLKSDKLRELQLLVGSPELKSHLEAFVCRAQFKYLECEFTCVDMDFLKRIVAYWKANDSWKSALVKVIVNLVVELEEEFAAWLKPTENEDEFCEQNGKSDLLVTSGFIVDRHNRKAWWNLKFGY